MRRLLLIPFFLLLMLAAAMVWSGGVADQRPDFSFINRGDINTLDPNRMSWSQDIRIGESLWEGLYALDPVSLDAIPGSADRIDISPDQTVYTFHIRPTARWSNGDPVVAGDFVFAWRRMLEEPGDYTYLMFYIRGARPYEEAFAAGGAGGPGGGADFASVGIQSSDPATLRVTLEHPVSFFPALCAFPPYFPLNQRSMQKFEHVEGGRRSYDAGFTRPPYLVSNGPYRLESWEYKRRLRMVANDFYWDRAHVCSRVIDMVSADDTLAAFLLYDSGTVDWMAEVPGDIAAEARDAGRKDLHVFPGFGTYFYTFNCQPKLDDGRDNPLRDVRVRQALCMSVDKRFIVDRITRLGEPIATTFIPPGIFPEYRSPPGLPLDVPRARRLLTEAGYPDGHGFPSLHLLYNKEAQHDQIAQYIRRQWLENLNIAVDLEGMEVSAFSQRVHTKHYAIARASWSGDYNDPSTFTDKYLSDSENNGAGWVNAEYDQLCHTAAREPDPVRRLALLEKAESILNQEAPIMPLYDYVNCFMFRDSVTGISLKPLGEVRLKVVKVER